MTLRSPLATTVAKNSSLSVLEEACFALQLNTSSGSSTESLDGLVDSHHHDQPFAKSTDASTEPDSDSDDDDASPGAGVHHSPRDLIDMRQLNANTVLVA